MKQGSLLPIPIRASGETPARLIVAAGVSFAAALTDPRKLQQQKTAIVDLGAGTIEDKVFVLLDELTQFFNDDRILFTGYEFIETGDEDRTMVSILGEKIQPDIHATACARLAPAEIENLRIEKSPDGLFVLDYSLIPED